MQVLAKINPLLRELLVIMFDHSNRNSKTFHNEKRHLGEGHVCVDCRKARCNDLSFNVEYKFHLVLPKYTSNKDAF